MSQQNELPAYPATIEYQAQGWWTIPKPVRFAIWIGAVVTIFWAVGGTLFALIWLLVAVAGGGTNV
jgi:hypothetical protein